MIETIRVIDDDVIQEMILVIGADDDQEMTKPLEKGIKERQRGAIVMRAMVLLMSQVTRREHLEKEKDGLVRIKIYLFRILFSK